MTAESSDSQGPLRWRLPAMRAVPALAIGLPLPFIALHSPIIGLIALVVLTAGTAAALWLGRGGVPLAAGRWPEANAAWSALAALTAAVLAATWPTAAALALIGAAWALVTGALELRGWWRMRREADSGTLRLAHDWRTVGSLTIILGLLFSLVRDPVALTGTLGAYAVIVGVYYALAALSARPAPTSSERSEA